jgi:(p)ppGpp synthase/HD superfamily hydrolase
MKEQNILKAAMIAAEWHSEQRRKGEKAEPYVNHLIEVAQLVSMADPGNTDLIVAALLNDAIEDQKKSRDEIAALFGERVARLVDEATDDKSLPKPERKRLQIETAPNKSRDAKLLKLADKTSNLRSVAKSPPAHWSDDRRREYVAWSTVSDVPLPGEYPVPEVDKRMKCSACGSRKVHTAPELYPGGIEAMRAR